MDVNSILEVGGGAAARRASRASQLMLKLERNP